MQCSITNPQQQKAEQTLLNFQFIANNYSKHLRCPVCTNLMLHPMRIHPCGHTFCKKCLSNSKTQAISQSSSSTASKRKKKAKKIESLCPFIGCKGTTAIIQEDRTAESLIDELKVKCSNEGCVWKGSFDDYKKMHRNKCVLKSGLDSFLAKLRGGITIKNCEQVSQQKADAEKHQIYPQRNKIAQINEHQISDNSMASLDRSKLIFSKKELEPQQLNYQKNDTIIEFTQPSFTYQPLEKVQQREKQEKQEEKQQSYPQKQEVDYSNVSDKQKKCKKCNSIDDMENHICKKKRQNIDSNSSSNSSNINVSVNFNINMNNPRLRMALQIQESKRDIYLKRQLKKLS